ncbi:uncharacterized protein LOC124265613 [Haliotis rubra]|uniref:uncharacterized protein LOC124265613 n=1 Tax=Haliotis rubra TaxID=36100 RepID=UPI001EE5D9E4|nr:uncharacterized protein LOC124265613 [Haliotis rubra]
MTTINAIVYLILMQAWSQVSGQDSNCPQDCTLVNIAASNFTSGDNDDYTTTGQASWVTDGVTSGPCASVTSIYPAWEAEFTQSRTVTRIKIFWEGTVSPATKK